MNIDQVYIVHHVRNEDDDTAKIIGIYSSVEKANGGVERLKDKPGFRDNLGGFSIDRYPLDQDHWIEGFGVN